MQSSAGIDFRLSPRQKRLRVVTGIVLAMVVTMVIVGTLHPFFHPGHQQLVTEAARKAFKAQLVLIAAWWSACLVFTFVMFLLAWMDYKEVRRKALMAQVRALRGMAKPKSEPATTPEAE